MQRYVEIWVLLQSSVVMQEGEGGCDGDVIHVAMACRQGKHRSVAWMCLESCIWAALGFNIGYHNTCWWAQAKSRCQSSNWPDGCAKCGSVMREEYVLPSEDMKKAIVDEFFHTLRLLEPLARSS